MVINNNYEQINSTYYDNNSLDVNYNNSEESEINNNYIDQNLFKGAHVVLVSEENPWYINKNIPKKYISDSDFINNFDNVEPYGKGMKDQQDYKSYVKLDTTLPDLGLGHSFLQRKLSMDSGIEQFNSDSSKSDIMNRNILIFVLVILIAIWLYRKYYVKKN
jgi:hypothetical protein